MINEQKIPIFPVTAAFLITVFLSRGTIAAEVPSIEKLWDLVTQQQAQIIQQQKQIETQSATLESLKK